jgi:Cof subfamily protein (haloacid dehalogenase superfamily)
MTGPAPIDLLLSDVDGTLVTNDKVLTPAAIAAVRRLHAAGIDFALTSARPAWGMRMLIEPLGLTLPLAGFNGGLIADTGFNVLESHPIDPHVADQAVRLVQQSGLDLWVYTAIDWVVSAADGPHVAREAWIIAMTPVARPVTQADLAQAYKIVGVGDDPDAVTAAHQAVTAQLGEAVSASRSAPYFLDITSPQANKGAVVHALARRLSLAPARIATIGDMPNDVLMFAQSGLSIAMGNASDVVKAQASEVTDSNEDDGFAHAVDRFILSRAAIAVSAQPHGEPR